MLIERTGYMMPQLFKAIFAGWKMKDLGGRDGGYTLKTCSIPFTDFRAGVQRDMLDLSDLMCRTLLLHREDKSETHLDTERIPKELVTFIRKLRQVNRFEPDYLEWLLDDSAFWTGAQKSTFMRKLWDRRDSLQTIDSEDLDLYMGREYLTGRAA
ncbi:hypothetical protein RHMOL_Rhmol01G0076300 [Rhododendron molle]|uniref:Uncharacterized protein n=1 Tax=Rhododendron molle TaxID=49168 RepID=A0ACC0Q0G8_RHOML|nr:hypothetical protein RHMOL_Rhmol01G0076300 [Rhododendron molle]